MGGDPIIVVWLPGNWGLTYETATNYCRQQLGDNAYVDAGCGYWNYIGDDQWEIACCYY